MRTVRIIATTTVCALLSATAISAAGDVPKSVQTIWNVGQSYDTIVKMTIDVSDAQLTAASEYRGVYEIPRLAFKPVIRLRTDDIRKHGVNYYGKRTYTAPTQVVEGIEEIRWKSDCLWINPLHWVAAWRMSHNTELQEWKRQNRELIKEIETKDYAVERFSVFYDDGHKEVDFNPDTDALLLNWSESSVQNFNAGGQDDLIVKVYHTQAQATSDSLCEASGNLPKANNEIQKKIVAECNVLAEVLYDDPSGNRRQGGERLIMNAREWKIDAGALNRGLLFYGGMDSLIHFEGTLMVRREPIRPSDCRKVGLIPFSGEKIFVVNSQGAKAGYHIGGRWQPFPLTISFEKRNDPNANMMEFWFDANNEVIRYAKIRIVKDDYDGDIPNPRLGKATSALKGSVQGRVSFELEYWTAVNQLLPEMTE